METQLARAIVSRYCNEREDLRYEISVRFDELPIAVYLRHEGLYKSI